MGVDCNIHLPSNVQVKDVASVIGVAAGLKSERKLLGHTDGWYLHVNGVEVIASPVVTLADILLNGKMIDGELRHEISYHFEPCCGSGRLLMPRSTAFWIAIGRRLVDFFGGHMSYQDCDPSEDYTKWPKSNRLNCPQDGKPWQKFQERKEAVLPLTHADLVYCDEFAAYKMGEMKTTFIEYPKV